MLPPDTRTTSEPLGSAGGVRKAWRTPRVIVSTVAGSEAKGPPTAEFSLFFSAATGTPNS